MKVNIDTWLSDLPFAEEEAGNGIVLNGWLAPSEPDRIRIVVGELCLSFLRSDVMEIEPVERTAQISFSTKLEVRMVVRRGAPMLDARLQELSEGLYARQKPFALSVRDRVPTLSPAIRFRDLEREFLRSHGLIDS